MRQASNAIELQAAPDIPLTHAAIESREDQSKVTEQAAGLAPTPNEREIRSDCLRNIDDLQLESDGILSELDKITTPILTARYEAGQAEFLGLDLKYSGESADNERIYRVWMVPDKGVFRVELSRTERPDLFALKDNAISKLAEIAKWKHKLAAISTPQR